MAKFGIRALSAYVALPSRTVAKAPSANVDRLGLGRRSNCSGRLTRLQGRQGLQVVVCRVCDAGRHSNSNMRVPSGRVDVITSSRERKGVHYGRVLMQFHAIGKG